MWTDRYRLYNGRVQTKAEETNTPLSLDVGVVSSTVSAIYDLP